MQGNGHKQQCQTKWSDHFFIVFNAAVVWIVIYHLNDRVVQCLLKKNKKLMEPINWRCKVKAETISIYIFWHRAFCNQILARILFLCIPSVMLICVAATTNCKSNLYKGLSRKGKKCPLRFVLQAAAVMTLWQYWPYLYVWSFRIKCIWNTSCKTLFHLTLKILMKMQLQANVAYI